ncbi:hypothetical protein ACOMHN_008923 [Nucella lapillus]
MDGTALQLKPNVKIEEEKKRPDCPKEDQAIRPDPRPSDGVTGDSGWSEDGSSASSTSPGRPLSAEEKAGHGENSAHSSYTALTIRGKSVSCGIVLFEFRVFFEKPYYGTDVMITQERPCETVKEKSQQEEIQGMADIRLNAKLWFRDKLNHQGGYRLRVSQTLPSGSKDTHFYRVPPPLHLVLTKSPSKMSKSSSKVSGKRQRRKKLIDLLGWFDSFHYLHPAPLEALVFPVERQDKKQGEDPSKQAGQGEPPPSGQEEGRWPPDTLNGRPWADFRRELNRLGTFDSLPSDFPVFVVHLADAGFLCGPGGVILCYFCGARRALWQAGDSPVEVHRQISPDCCVVTGVSCDNLPVSVNMPVGVDMPEGDSTPGGEQFQALMEAWSRFTPPVLSRRREVLSATSRMMSAESAGGPQGVTVGDGPQGPPGSGALVSASGPGGQPPATGQAAPRQDANASSLNLAVSSQSASISSRGNQAPGSHGNPPGSDQQQAGALASGNEGAPRGVGGAGQQGVGGAGQQGVGGAGQQGVGGAGQQGVGGAGQQGVGGAGQQGVGGAGQQGVGGAGQQGVGGAGQQGVGGAGQQGVGGAGQQWVGGAGQQGVGGAGQPGGDSSASGSSAASEQVVTYAQLGIITEAPKRPDMATVDAREATFRSWSSASAQTPLALAEAGLYYAGFGDCARCFQCGGGLRNWNPADDPWVEHARRFKTCPYVRLCQGQDFIDLVLELTSQDAGNRVSLAQVQEEMHRRRVPGTYIAERCVDPAVCGVQPLGCSQDSIDAAAQRLQADGHPLSADRLVEYLAEDGVLTGAGAGDVTQTASEDAVNDLVNQNQTMRQQRLCKICMDREATVIFLICGHLVCCTHCSPPVHTCPVCRQSIKGRVRAFPC